MIIDAHYHLDPRMETVKRLMTEMQRFGVERVALIAAMVDPFGLGSTAHRASDVMRSALMGRWPAAGRLMYRSTVTSGGAFSVLGTEYRIYDEPDNDAVAQLLESFPDWFWGWVFVNPRVHDAVEVAERYASWPGWIGVKAHPFWHRYPVRYLEPVAGWCQDRDKPLLVHLGGDGERGDYRVLPERFPGLNIIYAHAGVPWYRELWQYAAERDNVYVDLSSPYLDEPLRRAAVEALGARRCLYGTDGPFGYEGDDGLHDRSSILAEIHRLPISDAEKEAILGGTFRRLAELDACVTR